VRWGLWCALALALFAAGCGGGGALALDPVASAADRTLDKQTGRFETSTGFGWAVTASGTFSVQDQAVEMTLIVPGATDAPISTELRMLYPVLYVHRPQMPNGKSWVKVDLQRALEKQGVPLELQFGANRSPVDGLARLRGSKHAKKLGTETIDGVKTTHYSVTVDVKDAIAKATPKERKALERLLRLPKEYGVNTTPTTIDVWIGNDGLVRQMTEDLPALGKVTTIFSDWGAPVHIEAPAADDTIDISQALESG
jgi:hypothetical protein